MKKLPLLLIPILLIAAVYIKTTKTETSHPEGAYLFSGTAEVTKVKLAFKTTGRLSSVAYDEGDFIEQGTAAAAMDDQDEKLAISAAEANLAYSNAALAEVLAGSRKQEIRNAKAALDMSKAAVNKAKTEAAQARTDKERFESLYIDNGVSQRTYELYKTAYEKALSAQEEAQAAQTSAEQTLSLAMEGARSEAIDKARAAVSISEQSLLLAEQKLTYTTLHSPINGTVLTRSAEPGEFVQAGSTILTIADLGDMWIRGYVSQSYLGRVKIGQSVEIISDSYPDKTYKGKVTYISPEAEFTPKTVQTYEERINFMYEIKVTVDNSANELKDGMPVEGKIILQ